MKIIETIGRWGVRTSEYDHTRAMTPHPGDLVRFPKAGPNHRADWRPDTYGRIDEIGTGFCEPHEIHVCCSLGSAFLDEDGHVDISGGPFFVCHRSRLEPTYTLSTAAFWNWGDNSPGANQGVDYFLVRPVFLFSPEDENG